MENITSSKSPIVLRNCVNWNILKWSVDDWKMLLNSPINYPFRKGSQSCSVNPHWEKDCELIHMNFSEFFEKFEDGSCTPSWWYFDYKHIEQWLIEKADLMDINWKAFGYSDKSAKDSTLWIGTKGAHTPCHIDTYGSNIVAQLYGRKRWYLFPPSETENLQPTRVPYEESSIYSQLNFFCGCSDISAIKEAYAIDLEPGDVLFVPFHWWHYVENLTPAISVNMWIPNLQDSICRVEESLVKYFISSVSKNLSLEDKKSILNPNEDDIPEFEEENNLKELMWCVGQCKEIKDEIDCNNYFNNNQVLQISTDNLSKDLKAKCRIKNDLVGSNNITCIRKHVINSFCHPEIITSIRKRLLTSNLL